MSEKIPYEKLQMIINPLKPGDHDWFLSLLDDDLQRAYEDEHMEAVMQMLRIARIRPHKNKIKEAQEIQYAADAIIYKMCSCRGNMYAVIKEIIRRREGLNLGDVRRPLASLVEADMPIVEECVAMIDEAIKKFC